MSFVSPQNGETILHTHITQFVRVLTGVAGEQILLTGYSSASNYALTVRNQGSGGKAFRIMSSANVETLSHAEGVQTHTDSFSAWTSALSTTRDTLRVDLGGYGIANEIQGQAATPNLQAIVGAIKTPSTVSAVSTLNGLTTAVSGYAQGAGGAFTVALYGQAQLTAAVSSNRVVWPLNLLLEDNGYAVTGGNLLHIAELNLNIDNTANSIRALAIGGNGDAISHTGGATSSAFVCGVLSGQGKLTSSTSVADSGGFWTQAFETLPGAAVLAFKAGPQQYLQYGVGSQVFEFDSRQAATGTGLPGFWYQAANGDFICRANSGKLRVQALSGDFTAGSGTDYVTLGSDGVFINDTTNAFSTLGLTINQGAADNEILALKSSDVAHGATNLAEADTYGQFQKVGANDGGLLIRGYNEVTIGLSMQGVATTNDTTKSTAAIGDFMLTGSKVSAGGGAANDANANLVVIRDHGNARWLCDAEGDVHYDGTTNAGAWDRYDDIALLESLRLILGTPKDFRRMFDYDIAAHREILGATGVLTLNADGHDFVSTKGLNGFLMDTLRQVYGRLRAEIEDVRAELKALAAPS